MKLAIAAVFALTLSGCASQSLYQWGGYDAFLYEGYKDPKQMEALRQGLEAQIASSETNGQKVAPGLYAELGTLYLQSGASDKAIAMYQREREAWPESRGLMDAMIQNLERRQHARAENTQ